MMETLTERGIRGVAWGLQVFKSRSEAPLSLCLSCVIIVILELWNYFWKGLEVVTGSWMEREVGEKSTESFFFFLHIASICRTVSYGAESDIIVPQLRGTSLKDNLWLRSHGFIFVCSLKYNLIIGTQHYYLFCAC